MIRWLFYTFSTIVLIAATIFVPMPLVEFSPGGATSIPPLVQVQYDTTEIDGNLSLLTVKVTQPSLAEAVRAWWSDTRELERRENVIPPGIDRNDYFDQQRQVFEQSFTVAAAVGLRQAGFEVSVTTAPLVLAALPEGPSGGVLESGDVLRSVNGVAVATSEDVIDALRPVQMNDPVTLLVERDGEAVEAQIRAGMVGRMERPGLGVILDTVIDEVSLPFEVDLGDTRIGGPSAGMMIALTIYDLVSEENLAAGRNIAGTGTLDIDGLVGPIGGIEEKVVAAEEQGVTLFLAPASQAADARAVAPASMRVVGVETIEDAIEALRTAGSV